LSSILHEELGLAETSRAPLGEVVIVGDDIIAIIVVRYDDCVLDGCLLMSGMSGCGINST
jgi:hypothetical protein